MTVKKAPEIQNVRGVKIYPPQHKLVQKLVADANAPEIHGDKVWFSSYFIMDFLEQNPPEPKTRILEIGATVGHSSLPIAQAFPESEMIAVDLGGPVCRYGQARAISLGVDNIRFVQADGEDLSRFPDASFDWVQTTMFLHELSSEALKRIFAETRRLVRPGGIVLHVEQPQYGPDMPIFEQAMRDWDSYYNNEPFWSRISLAVADPMSVLPGGVR